MISKQDVKILAEADDQEVVREVQVRQEVAREVQVRQEVVREVQVRQEVVREVQVKQADFVHH